MLPLTFISKKITNLLFQSYSPPVQKLFREEQQDNVAQEPASEQIISSDWLPVKFVKKNDYWTACIMAPEISMDILNHSQIITYNRIEGIVSKVAHYTDADFGNSVLWIDYCLLPQKILLISNYDVSASYRYIIIPDEAKNRLHVSPPDYRNYYTVCDYYNIAALNH